MWKRSLVLVCALAACDGGGSSGGGSSSYAAVSEKSMIGQSVTITGPSMQAYDGYDVPVSTQMTVQFVDANTINVTVQGSAQMQTLTKASDGNFYTSDKSLKLTVSNSIEGLSTDQILYMLATQTVGSATTLTPLVTGNVTAAADLPQSQSATYAGKMTLFDDLGNQLSPASLTLAINFDASPHVSGNFTFGKDYVQVDTAPLTDGAFSTTVQSPDNPGAVTGSIDGTLYGPAGSEVGGTLALQFSPGGTPSASYVGYYGAPQQQ